MLIRQEIKGFNLPGKGVTPSSMPGQIQHKLLLMVLQGRNRLNNIVQEYVRNYYQASLDGFVNSGLPKIFMCVTSKKFILRMLEFYFYFLFLNLCVFLFVGVQLKGSFSRQESVCLDRRLFAVRN